MWILLWLAIKVQEAPLIYSLCIRCVPCHCMFHTDSAEAYSQHAQSLDGTMGGSIPLYRSSEEEKRVTVIKAPHYPGIGPVDESGIPTAIRTVSHASMCVFLGLHMSTTKGGLCMLLCIPGVLYHEDCPPSLRRSHEYHAVWQRNKIREQRQLRNLVSPFECKIMKMWVC